jgi:hypothetical protein
VSASGVTPDEALETVQLVLARRIELACYSVLNFSGEQFSSLAGISIHMSTLREMNSPLKLPTWLVDHLDRADEREADALAEDSELA